jgi:hypothetical protein
MVLFKGPGELSTDEAFAGLFFRHYLMTVKPLSLTRTNQPRFAAAV